MLFESEELVCQWLLNGSQAHFEMCLSCLSLRDSSSKYICKVSFSLGFFDIEFFGTIMVTGEMTGFFNMAFGPPFLSAI